MGFLRILLFIIEVIVCLLLIGVILLQKSRDSGLGMAFGAGMGESLFGAQAGNVLTRITIILAAVFMVNTVLLTIIQPEPEESAVDRLLPDAPAGAPPMTAVPQTPSEPAAPVMSPVAFPEFEAEPGDGDPAEPFGSVEPIAPLMLPESFPMDEAPPAVDPWEADPVAADEPAAEATAAP